MVYDPLMHAISLLLIPRLLQLLLKLLRAWKIPAKLLRQPQPGTEITTGPLPTVNEARERARLLHETIHDTLQVVHAQYYREDEGLALPAATLKRVFQELAERRKVEIRWLVVNARAMNVDHNPRDEFEKQAVKALGEGEDEVDIAKAGVYRYAGLITLGSECLKCHLPNRTSNKSRTAGLVISMPVQSQ